MRKRRLKIRKEQSVEECDAIGDAQRTIAGTQKILRAVFT